jgi:glyoxylase-like metal-dependent hydrolase (beta-lactamase superfamily II)
MAKLTFFSVGYCTHLACIAQRGAGFNVCKFPAKVWLIEINQQKWLWDTGYSNHFEEHTNSGIFQIYKKITPVYFSENDQLINQLDSTGINFKDIQNIIISHFHGDHIAGLKDFPDAKFICSKTGWNHAKTLKGFSALKNGFVPKLIPDDFEVRTSFYENFILTALPTELSPFKEGYELPLSDQQVFIVPLPGHAKGHIGAFVLTDAGWILIASDSAWTKENYTVLKKPSKIADIIMDDPKAYTATLLKLQQLSKNKNVRIYLSHEVD